METDRLRYFCAVYEAGSLTKASEVLGLSHSALSKAMSLLQEELGMVLFRPLGRGIEPTDAAREVYRGSREILEKVGALGKAAKPVPQVVRVGASELLSLALAGRIAAGTAPESCLLQQTSGGELETLLLERQLDFGFSLLPFPKKQVDYLKVAKVRFGVYGRAELSGLPLTDLPFVVPASSPQENLLGVRSLDGWPPELKRRVTFQASSLAVALEVASEGRAGVMIPKFLAVAVNRFRRKEFQLQEIAAPKTLPAFDLYLVKDARLEESQAMKRVCREIRGSIG